MGSALQEGATPTTTPVQKLTDDAAWQARGTTPGTELRMAEASEPSSQPYPITNPRVRAGSDTNPVECERHEGKEATRRMALEHQRRLRTICHPQLVSKNKAASSWQLTPLAVAGSAVAEPSAPIAQEQAMRGVPWREARAALDRQRTGAELESDEVTLSHIGSRGVDLGADEAATGDADQRRHQAADREVVRRDMLEQMSAQAAARMAAHAVERTEIPWRTAVVTKRPEKLITWTPPTRTSPWGLSATEFLAQCDSCYEADDGMRPCLRVGGAILADVALVKFFCGEREVDASKLTSVSEKSIVFKLQAAEGSDGMQAGVEAMADKWHKLADGEYGLKCARHRKAVRLSYDISVLEDFEARVRQQVQQTFPDKDALRAGEERSDPVWINSIRQRTRARALQEKQRSAKMQLAQEQQRIKEQRQERRRSRVLNRRAAEEKQQDAWIASEASRQADAEKLRKAKNTKRGMIINRWRELKRARESIEDAQAWSGENYTLTSARAWRGEVYALAKSTLEQLAARSMVDAVAAKLPTRPSSWREAKQQLRSKDVIGAPEDLDDTIISLIDVIEGSELAHTVKAVGYCPGVLQPMGAVLHATVAQAHVAALRNSAGDVWDESHFHAVKIQMRVLGQTEEIDVIADTGAGASLCAQSKLSLQVQATSIKPGRAKLLHSASANAIKSLGGAVFRFQLGEDDHVFQHEWQITEGSAVPTILGNDFWARYDASFNFASRTIDMQVGSKRVQVPFLVGDERSTEEESSLCSAVDMVVPPRTAYLCPTLPLIGQGKPARLRAKEVWQVRPQDEDERGRHGDRGVPMFTIDEDEEQDADYQAAAAQGAAQQQEAEEEAEALRRRGGGVGTTTTHPKWHDHLGTSVVPVNGINASSEPLVIRKGQRIALGSRLSATTVAALMSERETGTLSSGMRTNTEHQEGDWRRGKNHKEVIAGTREGEQQKEFEEWKRDMESKIKIGEEEEGDGDPTYEAVKDLYLRLIFAYREIISENPKKPGIIPGIYHRIVLNKPRDQVVPWREPVRRGPPLEEETKRKEVQMLLDNDVVEESNSPFSSNLVVVKKKDGTPRTCADMRRTNEHTRFDAFPLARIDEALDMLGKAKHMSTLDNSSAFWSILMDPRDRELTAFGTRDFGQLQFKRMPFGLKNATATYARALSHILRGLLWQRCVLYCDDNIVWGESVDDHLDALHQVFKRYSIHNVQIKISKAHFDCKKTEFVGHVVEVNKGCRTDPNKVKAMLELGGTGPAARPGTVQELKAFIGMTGYYKRFCKDYSHIIMPLRKIENIFKTKTMDIGPLWGPQQHRSFVALKAAMAAAPVLIFPNFEKPFVVCSDCSDVAKGAALLQEKDGSLHPIAYISQALNEHELRYGISDKEGAAATWACRKFRPYLLGSHTILLTDHSSLCALTGGKQMKNMRQQRYALDLAELSLTILHRAGSSPVMQLPDALSRLGYTKACGESMVSMIEHMPLEQCTVENLAKMFGPMQQTEYPAAVAAAASSGLPISVVELSKKLQGSKALHAPQEESLEEESLAVRAYDTVLVAVVRDSGVPLRRSPRHQQEEQKPMPQPSTELDSDYTQSEDSAPEMDDESEPESGDEDSEEMEDDFEPAAKASQEPEAERQAAGGDAATTSAATTSGQQKPADTAGEPALELDVLCSMQRQHPIMKSLVDYIVHRRLPADRLERIRVLETSPLYEVNQAGLLCRIRERGSRGSLGVDLQVLVPEALQGVVIAGCHQGMEGHMSVMKTFQKVRDRFYWPGMYNDVQRYVKYCAGCQLKSPTVGKAHITKHIEASAPGECVVIDLLHYPTAQGFKYVLVAVDAYSRWAEVAALENKKAATVADALIATVIANTAGALKLVVSDQGSEFKGELAAAMELLKVEQRYTAAYRSEGHGLAERYNRTISDILKSMVNQKDPKWHRALPWAKMAYNTAVHRALSDSGEGLSPAEVHLGRRLHLCAEAGLPAQAAAEEGRQPSKYVQDLAKHVEAIKQWVSTCRDKYQKNMRTQANKSGRKFMEFAVGQSVRLQDTARRGTSRKLMRLYDGPYQVLQKFGNNEYTIQKIGEGKKIKFRVHVDRMAPYNELMELDTRHGKAPEKPQSPMQEYEVEKIIDDTGSRAAGSKKYLVRWIGYEQKDDTWEPIENLVHCAAKVQDYELRQVGVYALQDYVHGKGTAIFSVSSLQQPRAITVAMDMNGEESPQELLKKICDKAGVQEKDIVFAWASPPCETFSRANASNISRGHHYRMLGQGAPPTPEKAETARQHDRLVQRVKAVLDMVGRYAMENPQGGLEKMWYMADWEAKKKAIELCAFVWPFRKGTNLWTAGFDWQPQGTTGDGRCHEACEQGAVDPLTKRFKHFMALAVHPQRGPRGKQATRMTCGIPSVLVKEILTAVAERHKLGGKVVLDLCSGFQSLREEVLKAGATYVAVDKLGDRKPASSEPRRAAVVLYHEGHVLAVEHELKDGTRCWTVPGGKHEKTDSSLHHTALRELREESGIQYTHLTDRVGAGPDLIALNDTTYFAYALNQPLSQAELRKWFALREELGTIKDVAWKSIVDADDTVWRAEDRVMLERLRQDERHQALRQASEKRETDRGDVE